MSVTSSRAVDGDVDRGYEPVREVFVRGIREFPVGGASFAAYVDGRLVVDIWGGMAAPGRPWDHDTLGVMMSATKGLVGLCAQILFDRGELDVEAPVAQYWPEFAHNGKERVLVRHVLTHTAGLLELPRELVALGWDGRGWDDHEAIASALASARPLWVPGERFGYHALTYGWLVGELVRRITGRSVGAFLRAEVAEPLLLDLWIGTPSEQRSRVAKVHDRMSEALPALFRPMLRSVQRQMRDPSTLSGRAFLADGTTGLMDHGEMLMNNPEFLGVELPAANGTATARSLAKVYAAVATGGELEGVRVVSEQSIARFSAEAIRLPDVTLTELRMPGFGWVVSRPVRRSLGYVLNPHMPGERPRFGPNPEAFGHDGLGGQIAFCDSDAKVAVGFLRSELSPSSRFSTKLVAALYRCAGIGRRTRSLAGRKAQRGEGGPNERANRRQVSSN